MEAFELKKILEAYNNKLDKTLQLNQSLMKELQLEKPKNSIKQILGYRIAEVVVFSFITIFLGWYVVNNWDQTHLAISGIIVHFFTLIALLGSIGQLALLREIDFSKPIVEIRKKIEQVNSHGLLFTKLVLLSAPFWWSYIIVAIDFFFGVDIYLSLDSDFVFRYLIINALLIVPLLWMFNKLSYKNLHISWVRKTIRSLAGTKTIKALDFLNDIEEFEN